jgi:hypothetical protein
MRTYPASEAESGGSIMKLRILVFIAIFTMVAAGSWAEIEFGAGVSAPIMQRPSSVPESGPLGD